MTNFPAVINTVFPGKRIVILGDLVADQFLEGTIARVSREAPVFILRHEVTETRAGGAANAAVNIASLGGVPILIGLIGNDGDGRLLRSVLMDSSVNCDLVVTGDNYRTTAKVRVLAGQHYAPKQQVIRIDYENRAEIDSGIRDELFRNLAQAGETADAIVVSDYNYGVADTKLIDCARQISIDRRIPLLVDSRFRMAEFPRVTAATPNQDEVEQILGKNFSQQDCISLRERLGYESLLITRGNKGMLLIEKGKPPLDIGAVGSREPIDVTGAGDTVIAVFALGLASGLTFADAATVAKHAGGIVVMKKGTASASVSELITSLFNNTTERISETSN